MKIIVKTKFLTQPALNKLSVIVLIVSFLLTWCSPTKSYIPESKTISLSGTQCGSYAVLNDKDTIGFFVKPFIIDIDTRIKFKVRESEIAINKKYRHKFDRKQRIYFFDIWGKDTVLMALMLPPKHLNKNPDWKCVADEVQNYPKHSKWIDYNLSKHSFFPETRKPSFRRKFEIFF